MFQDLDATLAALLIQELTPRYSGFSREHIRFAAPDAAFRSHIDKSPVLNLFLYDARENWELRSTESTYTHTSDGVIQSGPPVRIDCAYLITAWVQETGEQGVVAEHRLLGQVMEILLRFRQLPAALLQGGLAGQQPPVRARVTQQGQLQSLSEFWQAMGGQPKAALHYTVTLSVELAASVNLGPPVRAAQLHISPTTQLSAPPNPAPNRPAVRGRGKRVS